MKRLALALALFATPAQADPIDDGLPPPQYDIGGVTEADTLIAYIDYFELTPAQMRVPIARVAGTEWGQAAPPLIRVRVGAAYAECDRIQMQRYSVHYAYDGNLLGCLIRDANTLANPIIVYSYDPAEPELAARLLRHEIGHLLGWPGDHRRD